MSWNWRHRFPFVDRRVGLLGNAKRLVRESPNGIGCRLFGRSVPVRRLVRFFRIREHLEWLVPNRLSEKRLHDGMTNLDADHSQTDPTDPATDADAKGFGTVANRVAGWTNNLLATSIVILIAVTLGLGALKMWGDKDDAADSAGTSEASQSRLWETEEWVSFGRGDRATERREFGGSSDQAVDLIIERGLELAAELDVNRLPPPVSSELAFLASIKELPPRRKTDSGLASYLLDGPIPMVVTIATFDNERSIRDGQPNDLESDRRVVSWGLALPFSVSVHGGDTASGGPEADIENPEAGKPDVGNDRAAEVSALTRWTLFAFRSPTSQSEVSRLPGQLRLPPGSIETLSIASGAGMSDTGTTSTGETSEAGSGRADRSQSKRIVGFLSSDSLNANQAHFDHQFENDAWRGERWQSIGRGFSRRMQHDDFGNIEIQLDDSRGDAVVGLIILTSPN